MTEKTRTNVTDLFRKALEGDEKTSIRITSYINGELVNQEFESALIWGAKSSENADESKVLILGKFSPELLFAAGDALTDSIIVALEKMAKDDPRSLLTVMLFMLNKLENM